MKRLLHSTFYPATPREADAERLELVQSRVSPNEDIAESSSRGIRDPRQSNLITSFFGDWRDILHSKKGQSLIEILVALVVGVILIIGASTIIAPSLKSNTQANQIQAGAALGRELMDNVRVFGEAGWHNIYDLSKGSANHYHLATSSSPFAAVAGDETIAVSTSTYTRFFYVENASRDAGGKIVTSGGTDDPSTQKITVGYSWPQSSTTTIVFYLTRFRNNVLDQTDWSGGPGQQGPATSTNNMFATSSKIDYSTTTGSIYIKLQ